MAPGHADALLSWHTLLPMAASSARRIRHRLSLFLLICLLLFIFIIFILPIDWYRLPPSLLFDDGYFHIAHWYIAIFAASYISWYLESFFFITIPYLILELTPLSSLYLFWHFQFSEFSPYHLSAAAWLHWCRFYFTPFADYRFSRRLLLMIYFFTIFNIASRHFIYWYFYILVYQLAFFIFIDIFYYYWCIIDIFLLWLIADYRLLAISLIAFFILPLLLPSLFSPLLYYARILRHACLLSLCR